MNAHRKGGRGRARVFETPPLRTLGTLEGGTGRAKGLAGGWKYRGGGAWFAVGHVTHTDAPSARVAG